MSIKIGTCSWNYDSWAVLVYSKSERTAVEYLKQYAQKYRTVEIDSWFYKLPDRKEVLSYRNAVDSEFSFTCKVTNRITLTHLRNKNKDKNIEFLSPDLFNRYLDSIAPLLDQIDGIMFEFEYLNQSKMSGIDEFVDTLSKFFMKTPSGLPLAVEVRNKNYLTSSYFEMLKAYKVMHVFTEKLYMPPVQNVYDRYKEMIEEAAIIRLLGGDRKEIEAAANKKWDNIIMPKDNLKQVIGMINYMKNNGLRVTVNVNNHYEGSAPKSIDKILAGLQ